MGILEELRRSVELGLITPEQAREDLYYWRSARDVRHHLGSGKPDPGHRSRSHETPPGPRPSGNDGG